MRYMQYTEKLSWILDDPKVKAIEQNYQVNIDFVHSLGLKCDSVGWCEIDLGAPNTEEILTAIEKFCKENKRLARGWYTRDFVDLDTEWYLLKCPPPKSGSTGVETVEGELGGNLKISSISAYQNKEQPVFSWSDQTIVSEKVREACFKHGIDADFCWVKDTGRYASSQYFYFYPSHSLSSLAWGDGLSYTDKSKGLFTGYYPDKQTYDRYEQLGGMLPRLAKVFYSLRVSLPNCYPAALLPRNGFAQACWSADRHGSTQSDLLVHQSTADLLIKDKALSAKTLVPILLYDEIPSGYAEAKTIRSPKPSEKYIADMLEKYKKFKLIEKPMRKATEKEALSALRKAKSQRKEDFTKGIKKTIAPALEGTEYEPLLPYYLIANGGYLDDGSEYEFLSYEKSLAFTEEFFNDIAKEELISVPECIVIAKAADGDHIILCRDGKVERFSHEEPASIEDWDSLAQFFVDSVMLEE